MPTDEEFVVACLQLSLNASGSESVDFPCHRSRYYLQFLYLWGCREVEALQLGLFDHLATLDSLEMLRDLGQTQVHHFQKWQYY